MDLFSDSLPAPPSIELMGGFRSEALVGRLTVLL